MTTTPDLQKRLHGLTPAQRTQLLQKLREQPATGLENKKMFANGRAAPAIPVVARDQSLPLSFSQQRLWFLDQLTEGSAIYNIPAAIRLTGELNIGALETSLRTIVQRHEVLRTTFPTHNGTVQQVIAATADLQLTLLDLQSAADPLAAMSAYAEAEIQRPFVLAAGPLLRATLLRLGATDHVLLLTMHHIVSDGWSMSILIQEAVTLYTAVVGGEEATLPALPIQYADFAYWQRRTFPGAALEQQLAYWKQQLIDAPPRLELPTDHPRPAQQRYQGAQQITHLPQVLADQLTALGNQAGATLFMTLFGVFATLLARYSRQEEVVIGSPIAGRTRKEFEPLIGFFANTLALHVDLAGNPSFRELLKQVRQTALDAYKHQDAPFDLLVEALQPQRNLSYNPIFQVMFVLQNAPAGKLVLPGLTITPLETESVAARFDLTLEVTPTDAGLTCAWKYNRELFEPATIVRLARHFERLVAAIVVNPDQPVEQIHFLTAAERQQLLVDWASTSSDNTVAYPPAHCIHHWFEQHAAQAPEAVAVVYEDRQLSYAELNGRANQLARHLHTLGVGPEVIVGLCMERSLEMLVGLLGILKAGGAYLPLDPALPSERLNFMLTESRTPVLLTQQHLITALPQHVRLLCLDTDWADTIAPHSGANLTTPVTPANLVYVIFTSGSTGKPKGVAVEHRQLYNYVCGVQRALELPPGSSFATVSTLAADLGNTAIFPTLCHGGAVVVISQERTTDADAFAAYLKQRPVDCLKITPSHLKALLSASQPAQVLPRQRLILGGEASSWALIREVQQLAPACRIFNHYGPTETTVGVLTCPLTGEIDRTLSHNAPLGRPISNTQVYILDRHGQPTPHGVPGELYIGGASVARGYLRRPDLTEERFVRVETGDWRLETRGQKSEKGGLGPILQSPVPSPQSPIRLYRTGDLVRYLPATNGEPPALEFLGRIDQQVKIRGFRVEMGEIEAVLRQHPAVETALVTTHTDPAGDKRLVAYIVRRAASMEQIAEGAPSMGLRQFLQTRLPDYMVPAAILVLDALPLTPNGKVDRRALPAPDAFVVNQTTNYVAPRTATEQGLAVLWSELLGRPQVGIHDNFFEIGGHSLLATQLISRIRAAFATELPVRQIFEAPTIAAFATLLETAKQQETVKAPAINRVVREQYRARRPAKV